MAKDIWFDEELREGLLKGIDGMADAVKVTLGPRGRNVIMRQIPNQGDRMAEGPMPSDPNAPIFITNDGVTIARAVDMKDPYAKMGAELLKEAALKTNEEAGDGTTTAIILTQSIIKESIRNIVAGANPIAVKKGIDKAASIVIDELKKKAVPVKTREEISQVATISCQDNEIGFMIGEAFDTVGLEGVVNVDTMSRSGRPELEIQEGIVFERGYLHRAMITDESKMVAEIYNPYIFMTDYKIERAQELVDILILAAEQDRGILIIADSVGPDAMGLILKNKLEGDLEVIAIEPPLYGDGRRWRLEDLAVQTGGRYISSEKGDLLSDVKLSDFGTASYARVNHNQTVITGVGGDPKAVEDRINQLRRQIETTDYEFNKERFKERLAKFVSGVATIQAGGDTDIEIKEQKMRIEDAINAARAAIEEGVVAGGGLALLEAKEAIDSILPELMGDEKIGAEILMNALSAPIIQIAENAGINSGEILAEIKRTDDGIGFDADSMEYVDMIKSGIIDPVKVTRLALEKAVSVSSTLLTSNAGIVEVDTEK